MTDPVENASDETQQAVPVAQARTSWPRRIAIGLAVLLGSIIAILAVAYVWLDSSSGRRFVARQIAGMEFENGLSIGIGAIEGSLYGRMAIRDLILRDPQGVFASSPLVELDWRPFAFARSHVDIRSLVVPQMRLRRLPAFNETPPTDEPLLPDLDIDIADIQLRRIDIDAAVSGQKHRASLAGKVHIADRTAVVSARASTVAGRDFAGGETMVIDLRAVPETNVLDLAFRLDAPADGLVAGLTGVAQPMRVSVSGKGDWDAWNGALKGTLGEQSLANIALTARNGTFAVRGNMSPSLLLAVQPGTLLAPQTTVNIITTVNERRFDVDARVGNANFAVDAKGLVDLGTSRMRDLAIAFRLLRPGTIAENLNGAGIAAKLTMNGAFSAPTIAYELDAARLGFSDTAIIGLRASGSARLDKDAWVIPVRARASRIAGLNAAAGGLLENVRLEGDLAYSNARLMSDNMRLRSSRIDATAVLLADLGTGLYTGALNGRVNGYRVESVGIFNVATDIDLQTTGNGGFRLAGSIRARSSQILSDGLREFLGGNSLINANVSYGSDGIGRVDRLTVAAPSFRLTQGSGSYGTDGRIRFDARGSSNQYGLVSVAVTGTITRPVATVRAARPGLGVGMANVVATLRGEGDSYAVTGSGDTDYGPFAADVNVLMGSGPLEVMVNRGTRFAEIGITGRLQQTARGPFAGQLVADGAGIAGNVSLSAAGAYQRAIVALNARDAKLPGPAALVIGRAIVAADVTLAERPQIVADVQIGSARMNQLQIAAARAKVDYRNGRGSARVMAEGRNGFPFRIAANAALQPDLWRVALDGRANGIDFKTRAPARIIPQNAQYRLMPTTIDLSRGTIQLAGSYGVGMNVEARLSDVDLALINPIMPGLGLGGRASGSLDFAQASPASFPSADARLSIDNFTRTSLASVSQPVDMNVVGRLESEGGSANAIIRRRGAVIGRMQVRLNPLPPGAGSWTTRLLAAPLGGGLRYNGPADTLFSLAALPDQSLTGAIGVAADFTGRVQQPQLRGIIRANNLSYRNEQYGTRLTNMRVRGSFTGDRLQVEELTARAGNGTIKGEGFVSLSSAQGFPIQLALDLDNARLAQGNDLAATATGQLRIISSATQPATISGTIALPETRYRIVRQGSAQVAKLTGVRRKPALGRARITGDPEPISGVPSNWRLDVKVVADNQIYVSGMGLDSEWSADIRVTGTTGNPRVTGGINLVRGTLGFAGRSFDLEEGRLRFNGGSATNPEINLRASGEAGDVLVNIAVSGTGENPDIAFSSTPSLPQDEVMARILFGNSIGELTPIQAVQLAASLNSLRGGSGGLNPLGVLQSASGVDRLRILGADEDTGRGTSLAVGQYISNDVYVEIITDTRGFTATQIEISLSKALSVLSQVGSFGGSNVNVQYRKDY
ncbi:autotransporter secretion inner membrane protein TamB [Blastomonas natatoria]|uniref:Autotransporter secretion inner membrane protein TamB n=1 Tax=Blastomonas natatoria TaxID=34015 RepID=A0A2V3VC47_9SPHN|nr:translocation/assembly module TamB domain-containing protein [Blastomonas natatoria]PXW79382.1 autotransporter secretion inner membrane protein TamB [Blastomonas natatoria]